MLGDPPGHRDLRQLAGSGFASVDAVAYRHDAGRDRVQGGDLVLGQLAVGRQAADPVASARAELRLCKPQRTVRSRRDAVRAQVPALGALPLRQFEFGYVPSHGQPADLVASQLREPQIPVPAGGDRLRDRVWSRDPELGDVAVDPDPADLVGAGLGEPQRTIRARGNRGRRRIWVRQRVFARGPAFVNATDPGHRRFCEPHRPIRAGDDGRRHRASARGGEACEGRRRGGLTVGRLADQHESGDQQEGHHRRRERRPPRGLAAAPPVLDLGPNSRPQPGIGPHRSRVLSHHMPHFLTRVSQCRTAPGQVSGDAPRGGFGIAPRSSTGPYSVRLRRK